MSKCQCGYENSNNAVFCMSCGSIVDDHPLAIKKPCKRVKKDQSFFRIFAARMVKRFCRI
ncbi:zinc-ribbon domain-containing protein [Helicobacter trogontum]|uniref:Zinc-ribbon domain-containing protein n=1 Tax=Helicobacter trogontum TaxID=50960 RepID=A0A4U8TA66_9HELI|nr:zinc-ribbon domain-containing protein [Helicobacter trogontum]MDY5184358.1 zinc-ribbon domain-containing protein [Helicobacter trogontum]TLD96695.1 zinc-ribbon domain-containing protein [Helicobacter trogontum]